MTPKEKAENILICCKLKIGSVNDSDFWARLMAENQVAKTLIDYYYNYNEEEGGYDKVINYWKQVKNELQNL